MAVLPGPRALDKQFFSLSHSCTSLLKLVGVGGGAQNVEFLRLQVLVLNRGFKAAVALGFLEVHSFLRSGDLNNTDHAQ